MMKRLLPILLLLGVLFSSCSTSRSVAPRRYQTLHQKANATVQLDQHQYSMGCTVQLWRNELIILSVQPMLGIEMLRVEATPDSVVIFDKMNRRYTSIAFGDMADAAIQPQPSYKWLQDFVTAPASPKIKAKSEKSFQFGNHQIAISCTFSQREYNTLKTPKRLDTRKYKRISLRDILPL